MRMAILTALIATAGPAAAGSIDVVHNNGAHSSVERIHCDDCAPLQQPKPAADAVTLKPGQQKIEYRTVNGKKMIYRTEAWMGGSPVVMVSQAPPETATVDAAPVAAPVAGSPVAEARPAPANEIDLSATTSALTADVSGPEAAAAKPAPFDAGKMELRLQ